MIQFHHARLMQDMRNAGVTVEDLARAWASVDGKLIHFDAGKNKSVWQDETGHYAGYIVEMEEIISRAVTYANARAREKP